MHLSHLSLEYVKVPVAVTIAGVVHDPHLDVVKMAFPARGVSPVSGDWKTASWEVDGAGGWQAICLVGPAGAITLTAGSYDVWIQIIDSPEIPERKVGILDIT